MTTTPVTVEPRARPPLMLTINGEARVVRAATLAEALHALGYGSTKVATAVNGQFISAARRHTQLLAGGDALEIVTAREGG